MFYEMNSAEEQMVLHATEMIKGCDGLDDIILCSVALFFFTKDLTEVTTVRE